MGRYYGCGHLPSATTHKTSSGDVRTLRRRAAAGLACRCRGASTAVCAPTPPHTPIFSSQHHPLARPSGFDKRRAAEAARTNSSVEAMVDHLLFVEHAAPDPSKADTALVPMPHPTAIDVVVETAREEGGAVGLPGKAPGGAAVGEASGQEWATGDAALPRLGKLAIDDVAASSGPFPPPPSLAARAAAAPACEGAGGDALGSTAGGPLAVDGGDGAVKGADGGPMAVPRGDTVLHLFAWSEHHVLLWETAALTRLGGALSRLAATEALSVVVAQTLKHTFLASLMAAVAVPAYIIKACDVLDNPWGVAYTRAVRAGKLLARVLLAREQGARPVVLVGFSLGALLVWECMHEMCRLSEAGRERAAGLIQHAVLMGLPASAEAARWTRLRRVVAGRLINCYRPDDLVLALVHRGTSAASLRAGVAGLSSVASPEVESFDVSGSGLVSAHHKYRFAMGAVLEHVGMSEAGEQRPRTPA